MAQFKLASGSAKMAAKILLKKEKPTAVYCCSVPPWAFFVSKPPVDLGAAFREYCSKVPISEQLAPAITNEVTEQKKRG